MDKRMGVEDQEEVGSFLQPHHIYSFPWTLIDLIDLSCWIGDYRILTFMELYNALLISVDGSVKNTTYTCEKNR